MEKINKQILVLASTLLLGVASWLIATVYSVSVDTAIIKDKINKVYNEKCPYCIHSAHSSIAKHPLLSPTIKHAHQHVKKEIVPINN